MIDLKTLLFQISRMARKGLYLFASYKSWKRVANVVAIVNSDLFADRVIAVHVVMYD